MNNKNYRTYAQLAASKLFWINDIGNDYIYCSLKSLRFKLCIFFDDDGQRSVTWLHPTTKINCSFEEVFESVSPEIQNKLLFHLDLFR